MGNWLFKSEPEVFSYADLEGEKKKTTHWEGVRNYQARNMLRDQIKLGDRVFFYHSNCPEPGIVGIAEVVKEGYPDHTAFDAKARYYDEKSVADKPRWYMVDIRAVRALQRVIPLSELKAQEKLDGLALIRRGNRLSVLPVSDAHWQEILALEPVA